MDFLSLRENKLFRCMVFPVMNSIRYGKKIFFRFTKDAEKIGGLKDSHAGERCFIIGNGPSLTAKDLDRLCGEFCFAANGIYRIFDQTKWRPQVYLCVDRFMLNDISGTIGALRLPLLLLLWEGKKYKLERENRHIVYINNYCPFFMDRNQYKDGIQVSPDVSKYFTAGGTVTFNSIQLAFYMGFTEIYLLGVDHRYSRVCLETGEMIENPDVADYFDHTPAAAYTIQNVATTTAAYRAADEYARAHNIVIRNLTRGGALEVFVRGNFDEIVPP